MDKNEQKQRTYLSLLIVVVPVAVLAIFLVLKSVNVPNWDEWELVPILQHVNSGHIYWMDFWRQHNEHRLLIPNIILVTVAKFTRWNLRLEDYMNLGVAVMSFAIVYSTLRYTSVVKHKKLPLVLAFLFSMIWFSFVQADNWLWGWQIEWFLNVLGTTIVAYTLSKISKSSFSIRQLLILLIGGVIAQFSLGNGTLVWPILVLILLYLRVPIIKRTLIVALTGAITTILYYTGYDNLDKGAFSSLMKHPFVFFKYFIIYLGRSLSFVHRLTPIMGILLLISFVGIDVYLFIKNRSIFNKLIPWMFLGSYAISSAIITALARLSFGEGEAYVSRYTTISTLLLISTIAIFYHSRQELAALVGRGYKVLAIATTVIIFALVLSNDAWGFHDSIVHHRTLSAELTCTRKQNPTTTCLLTAYPSASTVAPRLDYLKQIHWGGY